VGCAMRTRIRHPDWRTSLPAEVCPTIKKLFGVFFVVTCLGLGAPNLFGQKSTCGCDPLQIELVGQNVVITWNSVGIGACLLQEAFAPAGPWSDVFASPPFTLPVSGSARFYRTRGPNGTSPNIVRYLNILIHPGDNLIASPFNGIDNHLNTLLALPADGIGSTICRSVANPGSCPSSIVFDGVEWTSPNPKDLIINPGEGFWLSYAGLSDAVITLVGEVPQGDLINPIPNGLSLRSSIVFEAGPISSLLGFPAQDGDTVSIYDSGSATFEVSTYSGATGWDSEPTLSFGTAFVLNRPGPASDWVRNLTYRDCDLNLFPPAVTAQPASTNIVTGATVGFDPKIAAGAPLPLAFQWRLNGINLPGANAADLPIVKAGVSNSGSYSVVIANEQGAVLSQSAQLLVTNVTSIPGNDNFAARTTLSGSSNLIAGNNFNATAEIGELDILGKPASASVWYSWTAPSTGIATFRTIGTSFDTVLAVSTGTSLPSLVTLVANDDDGGFYSSVVQFNATAGTAYNIAVAGYAGAVGRYNLMWTVQAVPGGVPILVTSPSSQTLQAGTNTTLAVSASGTALNYQWFFNGNALSGATNSSLLISNVAPANVGTYRARVTGGNGQFALSENAILEIGPFGAVQSRDKFQDLLEGPTGGGGGFLPAASHKLQAAGVGFISVSAGAVGSQIFNLALSATQDGEQTPCGVIGGSSRWLKFVPATNGVLVIDTIGSSGETVVAVYRGTNLLYLTPVTCDRNSAPDGRSLARFSANADVNYFVAIDQKEQTNAIVQLNWKLGLPPAVISSLTNASILPGGSAVFTVTLQDPSVPTTFQWWHDDLEIPGATGATLTLTNMQFADAGNYSVVISNFAGVITNTAAIVQVVTPVHLTAEIISLGGIPHARLSAPAGQGTLIQGSIDLLQWVNLFTNSSSQIGPLDFTDAAATNWGSRFYRLRPVPSFP